MEVLLIILKAGEALTKIGAALVYLNHRIFIRILYRHALAFRVEV
jgi:hypothetical protein